MTKVPMCALLRQKVRLTIGKIMQANTGYWLPYQSICDEVRNGLGLTRQQLTPQMLIMVFDQLLEEGEITDRSDEDGEFFKYVDINEYRGYDYR